MWKQTIIAWYLPIMINWGLIFISNLFIKFSNISVRSYPIVENDMHVFELHIKGSTLYRC